MTIIAMHTAASARSLATEFDALAQDLPGPAAAAARRRACELRLDAVLLREPAPIPQPSLAEEGSGGTDHRG